MPALIKRFVSGESDVTAYGLIAAALMLIGIGAWVRTMMMRFPRAAMRRL